MNLLTGKIPESLLNLFFQVSIFTAIIWFVSLITKRASSGFRYPVGEKKQYQSGILKVVGFLSDKLLYGLAVFVFSEVNSSLGKSIKRILKKNYGIMKRLSMLSLIGFVLISMVEITNANAQKNGTSGVTSGNNSKKNIEKTKTATRKTPVSDEKISNKWITVFIDKNGGYEIEGYLKADYKNIETAFKNTMLTTKKTSILIITDDNTPIKYYQYLNDIALKCGVTSLAHKRTPLNMEK